MLIGLSLGYIKSQGQPAKKQTAEDLEAKKELKLKSLKSKYVADRARAAKGNVKAGERLEALEAELIELGADIPESRSS